MSTSPIVFFLMLILFVASGCEPGPPETPERSGPTNNLKAKALAALAERLPDDAAPLEHQVFRYLATEPKSMDMGVALYSTGGTEFLFELAAMHELRAMWILPPQPSHCGCVCARFIIRCHSGLQL